MSIVTSAPGVVLCDTTKCKVPADDIIPITDGHKAPTDFTENTKHACPGAAITRSTKDYTDWAAARPLLRLPLTPDTKKLSQIPRIPQIPQIFAD